MKNVSYMNLTGLKASARRAFETAIDTVVEMQETEGTASALRNAAKQAYHSYSHVRHHANDPKVIDRFLCNFLEVSDMDILLDDAMASEIDARLQTARKCLESFIDTMRPGENPAAANGQTIMLNGRYAQDMQRLAGAEVILATAAHVIKLSM